MERDLLLVRLTTRGGAPCVVGVVHLESRANENLREAQLQACARVLECEGNAILLGDFNFCSQWSYRDMQQSRGGNGDAAPPSETFRDAASRAQGLPSHLPVAPAAPRPLENAALASVLPAYLDAWVAGGSTAPGYTFDSTSNLMLRDYEQMRYDRVLYKLPGARLDSCTLIGTRELPGAGVPAMPAGGYTTPPRRGRPVFISDHFGVRAVFAFV